jgi:hypothetical protein
MTSASARYRELVTDLVTAARRHACATATAESGYADGVAAIDNDLEAAREAVALASAEVTRAQRTVAQTDLMVASLWDDLKAVRGRRGRRLGPIPSPADQSTSDAAALLDSASARIQRARRGGEPLPHRILPLLFLLGACTGATLAWFAAVVFWPLFLVSPFCGLPMARSWVDHRFGARLDPGGVGVVVLGGTLATATLLLSR